jgi:BirA family biotin operon repressor/biotin-[acetyl-CoA-carboxylase] ligase
MSQTPHWHDLDLRRIRAACAVDDVDFHPQLDSTNDRARLLARSGVTKSCLLVLTARQTAGRGRGRHLWQSDPGSLTFSLLWRVAFPLDDPRRRLISLATACGICDAIACYGPQPAIKWPNDVYLDDLKVAGVLIESVGSSWLIAGCGMNVNNDTAGILRAGSLRQMTGRGLDLSEVLSRVVNAVCQRKESLQDGLPSLVQAVQARDWLQGRAVEWLDGDRRQRAMAVGISELGGLRLQIAGGERIVYSGSIRPLLPVDRDETRDFGM